jgi:hypothetical protein
MRGYFVGDVELLLAAYNAGEETVERYRGVRPYRDSRGLLRYPIGLRGRVMEHGGAFARRIAF